jgi:hypothetical protein
LATNSHGSRPTDHGLLEVEFEPTQVALGDIDFVPTTLFARLLYFLQKTFCSACQLF